MSRKLIITADDYGYTNLIDQAIIGAATAGCVTVVSAFANLPMTQLQSKIAELRTAVPGIPIGLHLTITSGTPLTNATSLMKKVNGKWQFKEPKDIILKEVIIEEVRTEIVAQLIQMKTALNDTLDHLSCHHNILYLTPQLFELLSSIAKEENLPIRCPRNLISIARFSGIRELNPAIIPLYVEHAFQAMNIENMRIALKAIGERNVKKQEKFLKDNGVTSPNYFLIHHYGNPDIEVFSRTYNEISENEVCEQIMHLAMDKNGFDMRDFPNGINKSYLTGRNKEFTLLMSNNFRDLLNNVMQQQVPIELDSYL